MQYSNLVLIEFKVVIGKFEVVDEVGEVGKGQVVEGFSFFLSKREMLKSLREENGMVGFVFLVSLFCRLKDVLKWKIQLDDVF